MPKVVSMRSWRPLSTICASATERRAFIVICVPLRLSYQEQGVEDYRFGEGDGQNRLDQNLRRRAWITSHCVRRFHPDQTNPKGRAERRQTNVQAPRHVTPSFPFPSCRQTRRVKTAHNTMNTSAWTKPTSSYMKE